MTRFRKGDLVKDRHWPEFGNGLITVKGKERMTVLFDSGAKRYDQQFWQFLDIVKPKKQRLTEISAAYERFKESANG